MHAIVHVPCCILVWGMGGGKGWKIIMALSLSLSLSLFHLYLQIIPRMLTFLSRQSTCSVSNEDNFSIPSSTTCSELHQRGLALSLVWGSSLEARNKEGCIQEEGSVFQKTERWPGLWRVDRHRPVVGQLFAWRWWWQRRNKAGHHANKQGLSTMLTLASKQHVPWLWSSLYRMFKFIVII